MTPGARVAAAIEVVEEIEARKRPAADALKDWGLSHRFAGSKDRAAIASLVFDAQRKRASSAFIMDNESPRASVLGALRQVRDMSAGALAALCSGEGHAPSPLNESEIERLAAADLTDAPSFVAGDFPEWLELSLAAVFGPAVVAEMSALATRAPVDLRVNTLKTTREKVLASLAYLRALPLWLPSGARRTPPTGRRVVHHDDVALSQRRDHHTLNIDPEAFAIDWPVEHPWRIDAVAAQGGEECQGLPVSVGNLSRQALAARSPQRPHICLGPGFIDEDQPPRINAPLTGLPPPALGGDAGTVLLARQHGFF
jgi:hypothetical protein